MKLKKFFKWYFLVPVAFFLLIISIITGWYLIPSKQLDIVVLNKTVPANRIDKFNQTAGDYRKHMGFYWLLKQQKYKNPITNQFYNYESDYYGPKLDDGKNITQEPLERIDRTPDVIYIADTYGDETSNDITYKGVSYADMNVISTSLMNGSTIIGESDVVSIGTEDSVVEELKSVFGINYTGWTGRFIFDMQDFSDVPPWALSLHEQEYGRQWDYKGSGILLVSTYGKIMVLEEGTDFNSDNLMSISITDKYKKEFKIGNQNYYNWFELITEDYETEVIAEYKFDLNDVGKEKFTKISGKTSFAAVTKKLHNRSSSYYFAGDFNDYVAKERYHKFLLSDDFYRLISFDRTGDITNFYWSFYYPLMSDILDEVKGNKENILQPEQNKHERVVRLSDSDRFEVSVDNKWTELQIKGFNLNAVVPGDKPFDYTRDYSYYDLLISEVSEMGGNCIRVYNLMPPEFYRALQKHNINRTDRKIYFIQSIIPPDNISPNSYIEDIPRQEIHKNINYVVDAVHGKGNVPKVGLRDGAIYINDVSEYLLGYIIEPNLSADNITALNAANESYKYDGKYVSGAENPSEAFVASICDYLFDYQEKTYGYIIPVGALGNQELLPGFDWSPVNGISYDVSRLNISESINDSFFVSYSLQPNDSILLNNKNHFSTYSDAQGEFVYGGYIKSIKESQFKYPVLIDRVGLSTHMNAFERDTSVNGLSEQEQGTGLVRILESINKEGYLGGLISDLNDNWSNCSTEMEKYTIALKDNPLWQNRLDHTQNTGVLSVSPDYTNELELQLKDTGLMQEMQLSKDEAYLHMTLSMQREIDYDREQLIIGLDTYQRNNGEYMFDTDYYANSLSGMEYVVKFESKSSAAVYVTPNYNRNKGAYTTLESYTGKYDYIAQLNYGNFDNVNSNFYQTGSTIRIRIPWSLLNFTDPSRKLVINDNRPSSDVITNQSQLHTAISNGIIFYVLVANKETKDTVYIFPIDKQANGYKTYSWIEWEKPKFEVTRKQSFNILSGYFSKEQ